MASGTSKRIRRTPEAARLAILEAAERRLIDGGPESVRVQHIAADLGVTDAAVHHHFGSREALIDSVRRFSARRLLTDIDAILAAWDVDQLDMHRLGELFRKTYSDRGASRLIFWVALSGRKPQGSGLMQGLIEAVHEARERRARTQGRAAPPISDTRFVIALLSSVHALMPVAGDAVLLAAGDDAGDAGTERFLDWVARLLEAHMSMAGV
ncbi:MAG TPA: helix-turn-helix domain-containing protein [Caulobacteraceae bacterium]|nr:helix-turn-helix domain-containing protein [Caulobacteraceae bacterium]